MSKARIVFVLVALCELASAEIGLIYGSKGGTTESAAKLIGKEAGLKPVDASKLKEEAFLKYDHYIIGAPTRDRNAEKGMSDTAIDYVLYDLIGCDKNPPKMDLAGKLVAIFGTGDQVAYPKNFVDGIDEIGRCFRKARAQLVGAWPVATYNFEKSKAVWRPKTDEFVGLPLDYVNQVSMTEDRVRLWLKNLKSEGMPIGSCDGEVGERKANWNLPWGRRLKEKRQLEAAAATSRYLASEETWYSEWQRRISCWAQALPAPADAQLAGCTNALERHLSGRFEAALTSSGRAAPAKSQAPQVEDGCEWVGRAALGARPGLPSLPELPQMGDIHFKAFPQMVPSHLQSAAAASSVGGQLWAPVNAWQRWQGPK